MNNLPKFDTPKPGFYKIRLWKNAAEIGAKIWFHTAERDEAGDLLEDEGLRCEVDGKRKNPYAFWIDCCKGGRIKKAEYDYLIADAKHARQYRPNSPRANPRKTIVLDEMKPVF